MPVVRSYKRPDLLTKSPKFYAIGCVFAREDQDETTIIQDNPISGDRFMDRLFGPLGTIEVADY